jgi:hypothetical protein
MGPCINSVCLGGTSGGEYVFERKNAAIATVFQHLGLPPKLTSARNQCFQLFQRLILMFTLKPMSLSVSELVLYRKGWLVSS